MTFNRWKNKGIHIFEKYVLFENLQLEIKNEKLVQIRKYYNMCNGFLLKFTPDIVNILTKMIN